MPTALTASGETYATSTEGGKINRNCCISDHRVVWTGTLGRLVDVCSILDFFVLSSNTRIYFILLAATGVNTH